MSMTENKKAGLLGQLKKALGGSNGGCCDVKIVNVENKQSGDDQFDISEAPANGK